MAAEPLAKEGDGPVKTLLLGIFNCARRCSSLVIKSSPVEPCPDVAELLKHLNIHTAELLKVYQTFHRLAQSESDDIVRTATQIRVDSVGQLVQVRKKWVSPLLRCLLRLGGCDTESKDSTLSWDEFLWIFMRFCSLSQAELTQTLFMIIANDIESTTFHYLTREQLEEFYAFYGSCQVKAFNTRFINFHKLPLSRYYVSDFSELATRFRQLLNPILHLQRCIQTHLPNLQFWDLGEHSHFTRKITMEFFTMKRIRVFLRGEPPFRETCDMLAPDALGTERLNQDQWYLRVNYLKQHGVWGEQLTPEVVEALAAKQEAERKAAEAEEIRLEEEREAAMKAGLIPLVAAEPKKKAKGDKSGGTAGGVESLSKPAGKQGLRGAAHAGGGTTAAQLARNSGGIAECGDFEHLPINPEQLCNQASVLDEDGGEPAKELPPGWMKDCCVAPAPQRRGAKPPLWKREQDGYAFQPARSWYSTPSMQDLNNPQAWTELGVLRFKKILDSYDVKPPPEEGDTITAEQLKRLAKINKLSEPEMRNELVYMECVEFIGVPPGRGTKRNQVAPVSEETGLLNSTMDETGAVETRCSVTFADVP